MSESGKEFGFASALDVPIGYMRRTRDYYQALGFEKAYVWAHYVETPFQPLDRPLARLRVALVTTAAPYRPELGDQRADAPYNAAAKFHQVYSADSFADHDMRVSHVSIDRKHGASADQGAYFPLAALRQAARTGRIGSLSPRFHGLPTNRSHRATIETDGVELLSRCKADGVDAAILVPNCPICHQSVTLAARTLERNGIATIVMGAAKDIVEHVGAPRFLFSDFPLGCAAGKPHDPASQAATLEMSLVLLERAPGPRTTMQSPLRWRDDPSWKRDYDSIDDLSAEDIRRVRQEFDRQKEIAKKLRQAL